uniref:Amino acid permease/ SLC12A domain-containing protein n=1 Tax=Onchocerca volvulus TaxID=6282 RepID=A0A8R1XNL4_ONCVO
MCLTYRKHYHIIVYNNLQDDNPSYGRGTLGVFSGVYISYMQNILLLALIFLRLPWIVGILSLSLTAVTILLVFTAILFSSFSIAAVATNGSDRLYGGPFTTIAYSLGSRIALVVGVMLCLANCGFTGICLTICTQLIQQYILTPNLIQPDLVKLAFGNNRKAIQELYKEPYDIHLILLTVFLILITLFNSFGKRIVKWICWIPFTVFAVLLVHIFVSAITKIIQQDTDLRCIHEPIEIIPKDHYYDQVPVLLYLSPNYTTVSSLSATTVQPSDMKYFCE